MAELTLEPYAVVQHWRLPEADGRWEAILSGYLLAIARECARQEPAVIGHIKALASFGQGSYFRASVVAASLPASTAGSVPAGCRELELILNVLVYGLDRNVIERITRQLADEVGVQWKGAITHSDQNPSDHHVHP